jgi:Icc-related predicted phosphoesterase
VVAISDTHGQHEKLSLPEGDLLIHAGDISQIGTKDEIQNFLDWFAKTDFKYKVFIAGNHDFLFERDRRNAKNLIPSGVFYLEESQIEIETLVIYGSPYTPEFFDWAFMKKIGTEIKATWDKVPSHVDILVTHGPPKRILDRNAYGDYCGCAQLREKVLEVRPKYHIFGHIHEAYGIIEGENTNFINSSVLDEHYLLANSPVSFTIE